ncbi:tyrosine--tRNA ligase [Lutispora thermophila]|uniref:Tyrosine--tRNA ligase n=1 Tax=Lutispora thermophila DSM 19022 TaxID=1122184 RepID=A0A1M6BR13_9FIRM|nr:tyrosine--tRNA ligase [Lutispora thermophila]SHI51162.1 tyrosyl-tRNA synthetase [Lutispora thermophila DSM 19022]
MEKKNVYDILKERGFIQQVTHEEEVRELLGREPVTFYIGFDPTADSLHVGHFLQMMVMAHMQRAGHKPIALLGGGTTMVGDPSGRTDMRKMLTLEEIQSNAEKFKVQFEKFIDFNDGKAIMDNNANWLLKLNYVDFLREIGVHFSVNRMLTAECYKNRMEKGLTFIEFNYMLMQAYDFLELYRRYGCRLQLGGDDQWSNIIAGADLIRRVESEPAYGMTFTLLTTSDGKKMGKSQAGAVWLDPNKTSPYDFYQYWRNVDDADVEKCLALLTFLPMEEVRRLGSLPGNEINEAKKVLAFEVTKLVHGEEEAVKAREAAEALFGGGGNLDMVPSTEIDKQQLGDGMNVIDLAVLTGLVPSKGEGRRLITQGGLTINDAKVDSIDRIITLDDFKDGALMMKKGKKTYHRVVIK